MERFNNQLPKLIKKSIFSFLIILAFCTVVLLYSCNKTKNNANEFIAEDRAPCIMVNDTLYFDKGVLLNSIPDSAYIGEIISSVDQSELPTENFSCNFNATGSKVYVWNGNYEKVIVKISSTNKIIEFQKGE